LFRDNRYAWLNEFPELRKGGARAFMEYLVPEDVQKKHLELWQNARIRLIEAEEKVRIADLKALSASDLLELWQEFHETDDNYWTYATLPERANYGSTELLTKELEGHVPESEISDVLEILTAPLGLSFYQREEVELSETQDMEAHAAKYFWLRNSYKNIELLPAEYFSDRKAKLSPDAAAEVQKRLDTLRKNRESVQEKYALPAKLMRMSAAIGESILWQDQRKRDVLIMLHYKKLLLDEVVYRYNYDLNTVLNMRAVEITSVLTGQRRIEDFASRNEPYGFVIEGEDLKLLDADTTERYWSLYLSSASDNNAELKGTVASKGSGPARGRVRILLDPDKASEFEKGDILVTTMTTPEYVFLIKQAGAVVTDTGGLTSHAAVVSREFGVLCVVGTKFATRVLEDGDVVEVDANTGVVRKM
jgi:phosphohistidine swiveling domain-containing protein